MEKSMNLDVKAFIQYYDKCSPNVRESLKEMFKEPITKYLTYIIKTYEDASNRLYNRVIPVEDKVLDAQATASLKLGTITKALNDGWHPSGVFYYPTFIISGNTFKFHEVRSGKCVLEDQQEFPNAKPFFGLYRDPELAQHSGETFLALWRDFYLGGGTITFNQ